MKLYQNSAVWETFYIDPDNGQILLFLLEGDTEPDVYKMKVLPLTEDQQRLIDEVSSPVNYIRIPQPEWMEFADELTEGNFNMLMTFDARYNGYLLREAPAFPDYTAPIGLYLTNKKDDFKIRVGRDKLISVHLTPPNEKSGQMHYEFETFTTNLDIHMASCLEVSFVHVDKIALFYSEGAHNVLDYLEPSEIDTLYIPITEETKMQETVQERAEKTADKLRYIMEMKINFWGALALAAGVGVLAYTFAPKAIIHKNFFADNRINGIVDVSELAKELAAQLKVVVA